MTDVKIEIDLGPYECPNCQKMTVVNKKVIRPHSFMSNINVVLGTTPFACTDCKWSSVPLLDQSNNKESWAQLEFPDAKIDQFGIRHNHNEWNNAMSETPKEEHKKPEPEGINLQDVIELMACAAYHKEHTERTNKYKTAFIAEDKDGNPVKVYGDIYTVLRAYPHVDGGVDHAIKKLLLPGRRGFKDTITDLREAIVSIQSAIAYLENLEKLKGK